MLIRPLSAVCLMLMGMLVGCDWVEQSRRVGQGNLAEQGRAKMESSPPEHAAPLPKLLTAVQANDGRSISAAGNSRSQLATRDLTLRFLLDGRGPPSRLLAPMDDVAFCGDPNMTDPSLIVDPQTRGIANVMVQWEGDGEPFPEDPPPKTASITSRDCGLFPHMQIIRVGDSIELVNEDPWGHVLQASFFRNDFVAVAIAPQRRHRIEVDQSEPIPVLITSQVFPWMRAYVIVASHPRVAISNNRGEVTLSMLPTGETLTLRVWHERGQFESLVINQRQVAVDRGRFEIRQTDESPGDSDMTVLMAAENFLELAE